MKCEECNRKGKKYTEIHERYLYGHKETFNVIRCGYHARSKKAGITYIKGHEDKDEIKIRVIENK